MPSCWLTISLSVGAAPWQRADQPAASCSPAGPTPPTSAEQRTRQALRSPPPLRQQIPTNGAGRRCRCCWTRSLAGCRRPRRFGRDQSRREVRGGCWTCRRRCSRRCCLQLHAWFWEDQSRGCQQERAQRGWAHVHTYSSNMALRSSLPAAGWAGRCMQCKLLKQDSRPLQLTRVRAPASGTAAFEGTLAQASVYVCE